MKRKIELGPLLTEDTHYTLHRTVYLDKNTVTLKIKGFTGNLFNQIKACEEKLSLSNNPTLIKVLGVESKGFSTLVILENFSNTTYELFSKNNIKLSQQDILNHAIKLSACCASLIAENYIPRINFETTCFDNEGTLKLIHPHLIDTIHLLDTEKSGDYGTSNATDKIKLLFRAPESFRRRFKKNEASSVYQFGLFLLYGSLGNLDFMNNSDREIMEIVLTRNHPAIPAHCSEGLATVIRDCLSIENRPGFLEIWDKLLTVSTKTSRTR